MQTDILTPDEIPEVCPLVDLTGGGEFPCVGASYHPPGSFARHDSVVWGYAAAAAAPRRRTSTRASPVTGIDVATARAAACGPTPARSRRASS